ncbi:hypothetical protein HDU67_005144 [Dinochytrium kinnereticum]|nr:hypothetical protein HDU67_005144 [Dinochytrium kinnereticum]
MTKASRFWRCIACACGGREVEDSDSDAEARRDRRSGMRARGAGDNPSMSQTVSSGSYRPLTPTSPSCNRIQRNLQSPQIARIRSNASPTNHYSEDRSEVASSVVTFIHHPDAHASPSVGHRLDINAKGPALKHSPIVAGGVISSSYASGGVKVDTTVSTAWPSSSAQPCWLCDVHHPKGIFCGFGFPDDGAGVGVSCQPESTASNSTANTTSVGSSAELLGSNLKATAMARQNSTVSTLSTASINRRFDSQLASAKSVFSRIKQTSQDRQESIMRRTLV